MRQNLIAVSMVIIKMMKNNKSRAGKLLYTVGEDLNESSYYSSLLRKLKVELSYDAVIMYLVYIQKTH